MTFFCQLSTTKKWSPGPCCDGRTGCAKLQAVNMLAVYLYRSNSSTLYRGFCAMEKIAYRPIDYFKASIFSDWNCPQWVKGASLAKQEESDKQLLASCAPCSYLPFFSATKPLWEHSLPSLQRATCLQKSLYPSLGNVTKQEGAASDPICCAGSFLPLQWPHQGSPEQRGIHGCLWLLCWAALGRSRSKGTVLATAHAAKNPCNNLFVYVFKMYSQD